MQRRYNCKQITKAKKGRLHLNRDLNRRDSSLVAEKRKIGFCRRLDREDRFGGARLRLSSWRTRRLDCGAALRAQVARGEGGAVRRATAPRLATPRHHRAGQYSELA